MDRFQKARGSVSTVVNIQIDCRSFYLSTAILEPGTQQACSGADFLRSQQFWNGGREGGEGWTGFGEDEAVVVVSQCQCQCPLTG